MKRVGLLLLGVCACGGGPILQNVPRPNPAVAAGIAAAMAGAATLADPQAATRIRDENRRPEEARPHARRADEQMPADVFDRMDEAERQRGGGP